MPAARTIHRLRLRAGSEADARGMAIRFEDALRTASLPDAGGRLVFVRRINLGRIHGSSTSMTLSLLLADAFEREHPYCMHAASEAAPDATAVWFRDALQAHTMLALRVAAGQHCSDWFWRLAVPGIAMDAAIPQRLRAIAMSLASHTEAPVALPCWAAELVGAGHAHALIAALDATTVAALESATGTTTGTVRTTMPEDALKSGEAAHSEFDAGTAREDGHGIPSSASFTTVDAPFTARPALRLLRAWLQAAGDSAAMAMLGLVERRDTPARRQTPASASAITAQADASHRTDALSEIHASASPLPADTAERHAVQDSIEICSDERADTDAVATLRGADPETASQQAPPLIPDALHNDRRIVFTGVPTMVGGIGFLLNVLLRLGYAEWLQAQPEWAQRPILAQVFARALHAVSAAEDDPAWALAQVPTVDGPAPLMFVAPERWRSGLMSRGGLGLRHEVANATAWTDVSGRLLLAASWGDLAAGLPDAAHLLPVATTASIVLNDPDRLVACAWSVAIHRWLRRYAGIGLVNLLRRPARLSFTPTHLDLWFDPARADLRIRRAGLDIDPGWLSWWGRVIGFHYERFHDHQERPAP